MTVEPLKEPFGLCLFCDDIRQEIGNKLTLVGSYGHSMEIYSPPPWVLPKFCILAQAVIPAIADEKPKGNVRLQILIPGLPEDDSGPYADFPTENMPWKNNIAITDKNAQPIVRLQHPFIFSPFMLDKPGIVRVRLIIEGKTYKIGYLEIKEGVSPIQAG